jgi:hypothetical protein
MRASPAEFYGHPMGTTESQHDETWIGLRENFNRKPLYLMVKTHGFPVNFPHKTNPVNDEFI